MDPSPRPPMRKKPVVVCGYHCAIALIVAIVTVDSKPWSVSFFDQPLTSPPMMRFGRTAPPNRRYPEGAFRRLVSQLAHVAPAEPPPIPKLTVNPSRT